MPSIAMPTSWGKVNAKGLSLFCRQLALVLKAGIPLVTGLRLIAEEMSDKRLKKTVMALADRVSSGESLGEGMTEHPDCFPEMLVAMVRVGEISGSLETILSDMGHYYEAQWKRHQDRVAALTYPAIVVLVALGVLVFLLLYVLPTFSGIFDSMEVAIPQGTQRLIDFSAWMSHNWLFLLVGIVVLVIFLNLAMRVKPIAYGKDALALKIPVLGRILLMDDGIRIAHSLSMMYRNGVHILVSMGILKNTVRNRYLAEGLAQVDKKLQEGMPLSAGFEASGVFPDSFYQMFKIGEETGALDKSLDYLYEYYHQEMTRRLEGLSNIIEPVVILIVGLMVLTIILSVLNPILALYSNYANF